MKTKILILATLLTSTFATTAWAAHTPEHRAAMREKMQEKYKEADADGDGAISKEEHMAVAEERFKKMDLNGDGKVTKEERKELRKQHRQMRHEKKPAAGE